ncbi:MAG: hypothetical protein JJE35_11725 [Thermoleophilia bacterium]|nr:hypothetical protein [Thermoleophilia bacterium]
MAIGLSEALREIGKMPTDHPSNPGQVAVMAVVSFLLVLPPEDRRLRTPDGGLQGPARRRLSAAP